MRGTIRKYIARLNLSAILWLAGILRLASILILRRYRNPETWEFGNIARGLVQGAGYSYMATDGPYKGIRHVTAYMPPGYPLILAAFFRVFGERNTTFFALELLSAAMGVLLIYFVYRLASLMLTKEAALLAALICAIDPSLVFMCNEFHSINVYIVLGVAALLFLRKLQSAPRSWKDALLAGICMGLLTLFRAEALLLIFLYAISVLLLSGVKTIKPLGLFIVVSLLLLTPWVIRNEEVFGRFIPTTTSGGLNLWIGNNPHATGSQHYDIPGAMPADLRQKIDNPFDTQGEVIGDRIMKNIAINFIISNPKKEIALIFRKLFLFFFFDRSHDLGSSPLYWIPSLLFSVAGIYGMILRRRFLLRQDVLLTITITFALCISLVLFVLPRYKIVIDPLLIIFGAAIVDFSTSKTTSATTQFLATASPDSPS